MMASQAVPTGSSGMGVRSVVVASADADLRQRLSRSLTGLRWTVSEAAGGAEAMALIESERPEALLVDSWLPDLEAGELTGQLVLMYPTMDLLRLDGGMGRSMTATRSPRRHELLHALREAQEFCAVPETKALSAHRDEPEVVHIEPKALPIRPPDLALPEMVGASSVMLELAKMIRLVAPRSATVLLEGETGTGKEVAAKSLHRLSTRVAKPFVVLNCAAIPETLLEAELFGHARGAFTGAVQSRTGRIEAAHGGTLFLDEIGEMPLPLQAKMLRFLENGELQRVGDNETLRVDVRVIAATHQPLEQRAEERLFRLDLYHRLAVFPIKIPPLRDRMEDLPLLVEWFLEQMGRDHARKTVSAEAMVKMRDYGWPGNVRELMHVLERGAILSEDQPVIGVDEIRLRVGRRE